jgi:hypothetical protein
VPSNGSQKQRGAPKAPDSLIDLIASCRYDPYKHVMISYPWGEGGGPLASEAGPAPWQRERLIEIGEQARTRAFNGVDPVAPQRHAISSGHGIGKTAFTAWLIKWMLDTRLNSKVTVTAGTAKQLSIRTWPELEKWHSMSLTRDWFRVQSLRLESVSAPTQHFAAGVTCREENSENFAGQHARDSTSAYLIDEASAVPKKIWEVIEGGLTDGEPFVVALGNPTRSDGGFYDCFHGRLLSLWTKACIDSRSVPRAANLELIKQWVAAYGEESDFVKVRVRGLFPAVGAMQFLSVSEVSAAMAIRLQAEEYRYAPKVIGVDVARYGDDSSVIVRRQGLACHRPLRLRGVDLMTLSSRVADEIRTYEPDAVFVDECGLGAGVVDRLRQLGFDVIGVNAGASAGLPGYRNLRSQMWGLMRDWIRAGAMLPDDSDLASDLTTIEYAYDAAEKLVLERKEDLKGRGLPSPDIADAIALTFAQPVHKQSPQQLIEQATRAAEEDYELFTRTPSRGVEYSPWR